VDRVYVGPSPERMNGLPRHSDVGESVYFPSMPFGILGTPVPGGGGLVLNTASKCAAPSLPVIDAFTPGTATAFSCCEGPPDPQLTVPVRRYAPLGRAVECRRSWPSNVPWLLVRLTN